MRPVQPHRPYGLPCDLMYLEYPERTIQYQNCCRLKCCSEDLNFLQQKVRLQERTAGVQAGARQGLDFDARITKHQQSPKELRSAQTVVFQALKKHLHGCGAVIKPGEEDTKGIVTLDRVLYDIPPTRDDDAIQHRKKIFWLFGFENQLRKKRSSFPLQASTTESGSAAEKDKHQSAEELQFQQQSDELMEILEELDQEFGTPIVTKSRQAAGQGTEHLQHERQTEFTPSPTPSIFGMSDLE